MSMRKSAASAQSASNVDTFRDARIESVARLPLCQASRRRGPFGGPQASIILPLPPPGQRLPPILIVCRPIEFKRRAFSRGFTCLLRLTSGCAVRPASPAAQAGAPALAGGTGLPSRAPQDIREFSRERRAKRRPRQPRTTGQGAERRYPRAVPTSPRLGAACYRPTSPARASRRPAPASRPAGRSGGAGCPSGCRAGASPSPGSTPCSRTSG